MTACHVMLTSRPTHKIIFDYSYLVTSLPESCTFVKLHCCFIKGDRDQHSAFRLVCLLSTLETGSMIDSVIPLWRWSSRIRLLNRIQLRLRRTAWSDNAKLFDSAAGAQHHLQRIRCIKHDNKRAYKVASVKHYYPVSAHLPSESRLMNGINWHSFLVCLNGVNNEAHVSVDGQWNIVNVELVYIQLCPTPSVMLG